MLQLQRCGACLRAVYYPRAVCPHCRSADLCWFRSDGRGRILSFSRVHRGLPECFQAEAPIVLAEVTLDDGVDMIARIVTACPLDVHSGMKVELVPLPDAARYPLPTFRPA